MKNLKIVYFPLEQKFSIWDDAYNLVKEWFNSRSDAQDWIKSEVFNNAKKNCVTCDGSGFFYAGSEKLPCSHGLSVTQRTFNGSVH